MSIEPSYLAFARANVRHKLSTTWPCVEGLVERIDRDARTIAKLTPRTITTEAELKALQLGDVIHCAGDRTGEGDGDQTFTLVLNLAGRPAWRNHWITYSVIAVLDDYETITVLREQPSA